MNLLYPHTVERTGIELVAAMDDDVTMNHVSQRVVEKEIRERLQKSILPVFIDIEGNRFPVSITTRRYNQP